MRLRICSAIYRGLAKHVCTINMDRHNIKLSVSRKSLHKLSMRQRSRVKLEIKRSNLKNCSSILDKKFNGNNNKNMQNSPDSTISQCSSDSIADNIPSNNCDVVYDTNIVTDESCSSFSFSCVSEVSDISSQIFNNFYQSFRQRLASCFVDNNLTHVQGNNILFLLRTHSCFSNLPKDVRTLLNTPRNRVAVSIVEPGEYIHFDLEVCIIENLSNTATIPLEIDLDFHTDVHWIRQVLFIYGLSSVEYPI